MKKRKNHADHQKIFLNTISESNTAIIRQICDMADAYDLYRFRVLLYGTGGRPREIESPFNLDLYTKWGDKPIPVGTKIRIVP